MDRKPGTESLTGSSSQSVLNTALTNGPGSTTSMASLAEAKSLLSLLSGSQFSQANLQQVLSAAVAKQQQQQQQRLPTLKPTNVSPAPPTQVFTTPNQATPISGRKRGRPSTSEHDESIKRRRGGYSTNKGTGEKQSKGLRHFSQLVCEKVREKGNTTYNEVADELVKELGEAEQRAGNEGQIDQKNIRRRVYDALNVLMAMNIISKEKKEIRWIGLPTNSVQECEHIQAELTQSEEHIAKQRTELHELIIQILTLKNLMKRNREQAESGEPPTQHSAIGLPFILVNTSKQTTIDCSISSDKSEYVFNFDNTFELHQDVDILKKMGLDCGLYSGSCTPESLAQAKSQLPKIFEPVLDEMAQISALSHTVPQSPLTNPPPGIVPITQSTNTSTPTTCQMSPNATAHLTPLLNETSSSTSSINSPMAIATAPGVNSPNSVAAVLSTLQQLQQAGNHSSLLPSSSPLKTSQILNSPPTTSVFSSQSTAQLRSGTVTARPLNFAPSPSSKTPLSPLLKSQAVNPSQPMIAGQSTSLSTPLIPQGKSPGAKIVTVQPLSSLPGNASVAEIIASLQQNVSSLLKQQQQQVPLASSSNNMSLLNGLPNQQQPQSSQNQSIKQTDNVTTTTGSFLTYPTT